MMRRTMVVAVSLIGTVGEAQTPVGAGVTVGVAQLAAARTEQVVTGVLQLRPRPWLALSAIPSVVRLSHDTSGATVASGGLGDLPLVAGATAMLPAPWTPTLGGALIVSLPTGDADRKSTRLNSSHTVISYAVFCLKKKKNTKQQSPNTYTNINNNSHTRPTLNQIT